MGKFRALNYLAWMYTNGQFVDTDCRKAAELFAQGRTSFADDPHFQVTCEKDRQARAEAVAMREKNLPKLTFNRDRVFGASGQRLCMRAGVCRQNGQNQQYREFTRLTGAEK